MPQVIGPSTIKETTVVTKDGECKLKISLDITLNINTNGQVTADVAQAQAQKVEQEAAAPAEIPKDTGWVVPDFKPKERIKFGK